jgi:RNA ligase
MKIKLTYPKIPSALDCPLKQCIAFDKIDGTNVHMVWCKKDGFHGFGTRRDRFDCSDVGLVQFHQAHPGMDGLGPALHELQQSLSELLDNQFAEAQQVILFAEFHGLHSFAGSHHPTEEKKLILLDAQVDGALLAPGQFIQLFQPFGIPRVVYRGKFCGQLFMDVRNGKYGVEEGVVVKGVVSGQVHMAKIKTLQYLERLKQHHPDKWKNYWE